jgi:hypothetical protein
LRVAWYSSSDFWWLYGISGSGVPFISYVDAVFVFCLHLCLGILLSLLTPVHAISWLLWTFLRASYSGPKSARRYKQMIFIIRLRSRNLECQFLNGILRVPLHLSVIVALKTYQGIVKASASSFYFENIITRRTMWCATLAVSISNRLMLDIYSGEKMLTGCYWSHHFGWSVDFSDVVDTWHHRSAPSA